VGLGAQEQPSEPNQVEVVEDEDEEDASHNLQGQDKVKTETEVDSPEDPFENIASKELIDGNAQNCDDSEVCLDEGVKEAAGGDQEDVDDGCKDKVQDQDQDQGQEDDGAEEGILEETAIESETEANNLDLNPGPQVREEDRVEGILRLLNQSPEKVPAVKKKVSFGFDDDDDDDSSEDGDGSEGRLQEVDEDLEEIERSPDSNPRFVPSGARSYEFSLLVPILRSKPSFAFKKQCLLKTKKYIVQNDGLFLGYLQCQCCNCTCV
jgi:hypothetical protein